MNRILAILGATLMLGVAFAGCLGQDDGGGGPTTTPTGDGGPLTNYATHEFMKDPAVRQALSFAFPYETVHEQVYQGFMSPLPGPIPNGMPFYDTQTQRYTEDLQRAGQILDDAGYTADGDARFGGEALRIFYNSGNTQREQNAQLFKQNLAQIGINAEVQGLAWPQFLERMFETTNWDIMFLGWAPDFNDPDDYWFPFAASADIEGFPDLHGDTYNTGYSNAQVDEALMTGKYSADENERREAYQTAFDIYMNEPSLIFIGQNQAVITLREWVQGYEYNPMVSEPGYFHDFSKASGARTPNTFVYATFGDPKNLDPADAYDTASGLVIQNVYDTLVRYQGAETTDVAPRLAESWNVSDDGLTYTFNLRRNVQFSNGNPFTADDVVYSFQRVLALGAPESGVSWILEQSLNETSVEKVDDHTVRMTLTQPYGGFLPTIAYTVGSIIDKEYCEANGGMPQTDDAGEVTDLGCAEFLKENPMGTNAYTLERWDKNSEVVLTQNENYWGGWEGNRITRAIIRNIEEPNTRILALQNGDADYAVVDLDKLDQVRDREGITILTHDSFTVTLGIMQTNPTVE